MPSLPTSLIVVGLVVAWLVVLVPMVARRREEVPENTEEGASFRVLQRDSAAGRRRPIFSRTAMAHRSREDSDPGDDHDMADEVPAGEARDHDARDEDARVIDDEVQVGDNSPVRGGANGRGGASISARSREEVGGRDATSDDGEAGVSAEVGGRDVAELRVRSGVSDVGGVRDNAEAGTRVPVSVSGAVDDKGGMDDAADPESSGESSHGLRSAAAREYGPTMTSEGTRTARATYDVSRGEAEEVVFASAHGGEGEFRRMPIRRGRGGFDPEVADRARAYRFRQRRRVALALVVVAVAGVLVGLLGMGYGFVAAIASGVLLVLYLAYLRRQVRVENEIRARRAARLERARQIRPGYRPSVAEQVYAHRTGEIPRPGAVGQYHVKSHARETVPPTGYGYGEPVDVEDSDPAFDDLEYYRPAAYGRRAG